jgi:hypothetical protein
MERNPCAQKYEKLLEVYRGTGSEEIKFKFLQTASDDQCRYDIPTVTKY